MVAAGLTDAKIKALRAPATGQVEYRDNLVPGLRLRVGSSGAKTFILRKRVGGRARNLTLDRYHDRRFTVADARSIRGKAAVNFLNNPNVFIDRVTGTISISGKAGDYAGQCEVIDASAPAKF